MPSGDNKSQSRLFVARILSNVPRELFDLRQWIHWELTPDGRKLPIHDPRAYGRDAMASVDRPETWRTLSDRLAEYRMGLDASRVGVGFVFTRNGNLIAIDIDDCRDPVTGVIAKWAMHWIRMLNSYAEVSPSGTGVKIWLRGSVPMRRMDFGTGKKTFVNQCGLPFDPNSDSDVNIGAVEIYDSGRYFTVTGEHVECTPKEIRSCDEGLEDLVWLFWPKQYAAWRRREPETSPQTMQGSAGLDPGVFDAHGDEILSRADKYVQTITGAISGHGGHDQTFYVACKLIHGFGLSPEQALPVMRRYNAKCEPAWSESELEHKLRSADGREDRQGRSRGYLVGDVIYSTVAPAITDPSNPTTSNKPAGHLHPARSPERIEDDRCEREHQLAMHAVEAQEAAEELRRKALELIRKVPTAARAWDSWQQHLDEHPQCRAAGGKTRRHRNVAAQIDASAFTSGTKGTCYIGGTLDRFGGRCRRRSCSDCFPWLAQQDLLHAAAMLIQHMETEGETNIDTRQIFLANVPGDRWDSVRHSLPKMYRNNPEAKISERVTFTGAGNLAFLRCRNKQMPLATAEYCVLSNQTWSHAEIAVKSVSVRMAIEQSVYSLISHQAIAIDARRHNKRPKYVLDSGAWKRETEGTRGPKQNTRKTVFHLPGDHLETALERLQESGIRFGGRKVSQDGFWEDVKLNIRMTPDELRDVLTGIMADEIAEHARRKQDRADSLVFDQLIANTTFSFSERSIEEEIPLIERSEIDRESTANFGESVAPEPLLSSA